MTILANVSSTDAPERLKLRRISRINNQVTKAAMSGAVVDPSLFENLRQLHTLVLTDWRNGAKRVDLARAQVVGGSSSSAIYQLTKAEEYSAGGDTKQLLTISILKGAALSEIGRYDEAQEQFRTAVRIGGPDSLNETTLKTLKLKPSTIDFIKQQKFTGAGPREQQDLLKKLIEGC